MTATTHQTEARAPADRADNLDDLSVGVVYLDLGRPHVQINFRAGN